MDLVTGALSMLQSKLLELLNNEYKLQKGVKDQIRSLTPELENMHAVLHKIGNVPLDDLDEQAKLWARDVREASYDMEDILDAFLVYTYCHDHDDQSGLKRVMHYMGDRIHKLKAKHDIATGIQEIKKQVLEAAERRARYKIGDNLVNPEAEKRVDPRLGVLFPEALQPVGIDEPRDALIQMLYIGKDDTSYKKPKTVTIVGSGGLGKTTLAKAVYEKVNHQFDYVAFVPVGSSPDPKKVLRDILIDLTDNGANRKKNSIIDAQKWYTGADLLMSLDERQLINIIRNLLQENRYLIVLDDIWDTSIWATISNAFKESNQGSRIIVTSRNSDVSEKIGDVYTMKPLSDSDSRMLLYTRLTSGGKHQWPENEELVKKILHKCRGVPLAITTTAIVLANTEINEWSNVYNSVGFGHEDDEQVNNTMKILSISYYDLPSHLKTCMLYLSTFPEDYFVEKNMLIWRWIAEGLVHKKDGKEVEFEVGESYFHELVRRGMILPVEDNWRILVGCRVHDMVLQMIRDIAREQNFTIVQDTNRQGLQGKLRRLALHKDKAEMIQDNDSGLPQLRSFSAFFCQMNIDSPVSRFKLLRVLALENCSSVEGYDCIGHIGKLLHLRYLGLSGTPIRQLPKKLGHLRFMQTMILIGTGVQELPASMVHLKKLMCLRADEKVRVPDWIGKLTSLVELEMYPAADDKCFVKELGKLRNLRVLKSRISLQDEGQGREFVESLDNLQNIKFINMEMSKGFDFKNGVVEPSLALHGNLHVLKLEAFMFSRLPESINPEDLPNLYCLHLVLSELDQKDMEILGGFQKLCYLHLSAFKLLSSSIVIPGNGRFQNLKSFDAFFYTPMFVQGAMPRLENIMLHIPVREVKIDNPNLDFGLRHLSSLKNLITGINCIGCLPAELEEMEAAIRHAVNIHPNHPALLLHRAAEDGMATSDSFREKFERQVLRMGKLNGRVGDQKKLHTEMRDEAFDIAEQLMDLNAKNKMQRYGEQIDVTLDRVERELEGDKDNYNLISRVANDSAAMERALAIFTEGYLPLTTILDDLRTAPNLQASVIEKLNVQSQKLNEQIDRCSE
ncbi:unnamed protein product [Urochloa humidicola]